MLLGTDGRRQLLGLSRKEVIPLHRRPEGLAKLPIRVLVAMSNGLSKLSIKAVKRLFRPMLLFGMAFDRRPERFLVFSEGEWVLFREVSADGLSQGDAKAPWLLVS